MSVKDFCRGKKYFEQTIDNILDSYWVFGIKAQALFTNDELASMDNNEWAEWMKFILSELTAILDGNDDNNVYSDAHKLQMSWAYHDLMAVVFQNPTRFSRGMIDTKPYYIDCVLRAHKASLKFPFGQIKPAKKPEKHQKHRDHEHWEIKQGRRLQVKTDSPTVSDIEAKKRAKIRELEAFQAMQREVIRAETSALDE